MDLRQVDLETLKKEVMRRELARRLARPATVDNPNMQPVIDMIVAYIDRLANGERSNEDIAYYVFETAVMAVYGKDVFTWINAIER